MDPQPSLILDYASPRGRSKIALPAQSILTLHTDDTSVLVSEHLQFVDGALAAIAFAIFVLLWLAYLLFTVRHTAGFIVPVWLIEFSLLLKVTHDTFHKTKLEAYPDRLTLEFLSPFRHRTYAWPAEQVITIVSRPSSGNFTPTLATLVIQIASGPTLHLFTGHPHRTLSDLTGHIAKVLFPQPDEPPGIP